MGNREKREAWQAGRNAKRSWALAEGWRTSVSAESLAFALTGFARGDVGGGGMNRGGARSVIRFVRRRLMEGDHAGDGAEDEDGGDEHPIADDHGAGLVPPETADQVTHGLSFSHKATFPPEEGEKAEKVKAWAVPHVGFETNRRANEA
jgi:hypothetical protein